MSKQIFKTNVPKEILFDLLDKICEPKEDGRYLVDNATYKRMKYHNYHEGFLATLIIGRNGSMSNVNLLISLLPIY
jgi:hypothetical protein